MQRWAISLMALVRFPVVQLFSLLHNSQTDSGAHPVSYTIGTGVILPDIKAVGA
jgi:hypothetical protein